MSEEDINNQANQSSSEWVSSWENTNGYVFQVSEAGDYVLSFYWTNLLQRETQKDRGLLWVLSLHWKPQITDIVQPLFRIH